MQPNKIPMKDFIIVLACLIPPALCRLYLGYLRKVEIDLALALSVIVGCIVYGVFHQPDVVSVMLAAGSYILMRFERVA